MTVPDPVVTPHPGEPVVAVLAEEWTALGALGDELASDEWALPTECPGWTVRDLFSHMVGTERSLLGEPAPPGAGPVAHVHNAVGAANEAWVAPRRSLPGPEVLAEFRQVTASRLARLAAMTSEQWSEPGPSPVGVVPYREFMAVRVMDCWVHEQDARVATGRAGRFDGSAAALALDRLASALGYVVAKPAQAPEGSSVRFEIIGSPGRRIDVAVRQGRGVVGTAGAASPANTAGAASAANTAGAAGAANTAGAAGDPTTVLEMDLELFWRLTCGRVPGDAALGAGLVRVHGDEELGARVVRNMAFMI